MAKAGIGSLLTEQEILNRVFDTSSNSLGVEKSFLYKNMTLSGCPAGNIVATARFLHSITFNQPISGVSTVVTDSTAAGGDLVGTVINPLGGQNLTPYTVTYNVALANGFAASQVSPIATGSNLTVSYRN